MNQKRPYRPPAGETHPEYLRQIDIDVVGRNGKITGHRLVRNVVFRVRRRTGLVAGEYVFQYAEVVNGVTLIYGERYGMRKTVLESDIIAVVASK